MAYASRSRSPRDAGRARSGRARNGGRGGARGGGGGNATLVIVALFIVGGGIAAIVLLGGDSKKKTPGPRPTELTADSTVPREARPGPAAPTRSPPPPLSEGVKAHAAEVAKEIAPLDIEAKGIYDEAMTAKAAGDEKTWQTKLKEAASVLGRIQERWNDEIIDAIQMEIPSTSDWDAEEVANHYLGAEGQKISKALELLAAVKKQIRLD
jgi:hypothetical protein